MSEKLTFNSSEAAEAAMADNAAESQRPTRAERVRVAATWAGRGVRRLVETARSEQAAPARRIVTEIGKRVVGAVISRQEAGATTTLRDVARDTVANGRQVAQETGRPSIVAAAQGLREAWRQTAPEAAPVNNANVVSMPGAPAAAEGVVPVVPPVEAPGAQHAA